MNDKQRAWIAAATEALQDTKSWTGRIHLHKHLFITQILNLAEVPFEFELHHFGPYSFELDSDIAEMEAFGELDKKYPKPGYGPSYEVTELGRESVAHLTALELETAKDVAQRLATMNSGDLELVATCLWVELNEEENDPERIPTRVREIKPKYPLSRIDWALKRAEELRATLA